MGTNACGVLAAGSLHAVLLPGVLFGRGMDGMDVDLAHLHFHLFVFVLRYVVLALAVLLQQQQREVLCALCVWPVW